MKQQIIILCGPDMTGKTQIAKELSKITNVPYFKASSEHHAFLKDPEKFIKDIRYADPRLVDFVKQTGASVIFDRGFPCEWVYSKAFNRETDLDAIKRIDDAYAVLDTRVIVCMRKNGFDGIVDDIDPKRLNSKKLQEIQEIYYRYAVFHMLCKSMFLYVDDENLQRECDEVLKFLET